jgi:hypothetical protein
MALPAARSGALKLTWTRQLRAIAASVLIFGLITALVIHSSSGPVLASAAQLARIHEEVLQGAGVHVTQVDSVNAANVTLATNHPGLPAIPDLPQDHVMSCCVHTIGRKQLACLSVQVDGILVSIAVADAANVKMPPCPAVTISGIEYHVQSQGDINMAMTERDGRWVCVMGRLPTNRLAELASTLRF